MKAFVVLVIAFFLAAVSIGASEDEKDLKRNAPMADESGFSFYGSDVFKPRPARWQSHIKSGAGEGMQPEKDPNYYPKLFNWLDKVGRR